MRFVKILLILVLAAVAGLYGFTTLSQRMSGDNTAPVIQCSSDPLEVSVKDDDSVLFTGITASDKQDGDLTDRIYLSGLSKMVDHTVKATYLVFDSDNNMASYTRQIRYADYTSPRFEVTQPLIYYSTDSIGLLDRLRVIDNVDGDITSSIRVSTLSATDISNVYTVSLQVTNSMGDTIRVELPVIQLSSGTSHSTVNLSKYLVYVSQGSSFSPKSYLLSVDTPTGEGSTNDVLITSTVDTSTPGTYQVRYDYPGEDASGLSILTVVVE